MARFGASRKKEELGEIYQLLEVEERPLTAMPARID